MKKLWVRLSLSNSGLILLFMALQALVYVALVISGVVAPGLPLEAWHESRSIGWKPYFPVLGPVIGVGVIGGVAGIVTSRSLSAPLGRMSEAAAEIGSGDLSQRVEERGSEEMVSLAQSFNQMASDLERSEQQRSNLMADVSHELRTPLTVLEGNLRAVLDGVYTLDDAEVADLYNQTRHLIRLVEDLHELSLAEARQLSYEMVAQDITAIVRETLAVFAPLAESKTVSLQSHLVDGIVATVDGMRLKQVLHNLLSNALRHTPEGGSIRITLALENDDWELTVTDSGRGIPAEHLPNVFNRFYRVDGSRSRQSGGTGLGLAIAQAIVQGHGGRIEASSPGEGRGASFTVCLPIAADLTPVA